jgi:hypothetical protein
MDRVRVERKRHREQTPAPPVAHQQKSLFRNDL